MAKRFTDLPQLTAPASDDELAIVDISANVTKRISLLDMLSNFIDAVHIKANAIITSKINDGAVTAAKIEVQQAWVAPTLQNSWVNYGGIYAAAGYYKDSLGIVRLRGLVKNGTVGGVAAFTLPVNYRPSADIILTVTSNNAWGQVRVTSTGAVQMYQGSATWFSIENLSFKAEQ